MTYWTDDRRLDYEQRRLDAQQEDAATRLYDLSRRALEKALGTLESFLQTRIDEEGCGAFFAAVKYGTSGERGA